MNELYLKKLDETIEGYMKRKTTAFNLDMLVNLMIAKFNTTTNTSNDNQLFENILIVKYF